MTGSQAPQAGMNTERSPESGPPKRGTDLAQILEAEIAAGLIAPGSRMEEAALAERFGVSRTPVREALRFLGASGLVELRPHKGAIVADLGIEQLLEMFETMAELESICGRLAARRMSGEERLSLSEQHRRCEDARATGDADHYYEANAEFHEIIYSGTHNRFLVEEVRRLSRRLAPYRRLQLRSAGRMGDSLAEHEAITEAIIAGDGESAADRLRAHVSVQGDRFGDWVASLSAARMTPGTNS